MAPTPAQDSEDARLLRSSPPEPYRAAMGAALLIGVQVAGKAARDAYFLNTVGVAHLPAMIGAAAVVSIAAVLAANAWVARRGPGRVAPLAGAASALLFVLEWWATGVAPAAAAVALYLHVAAFGGILVSLFWSIVGEVFDPRSARRSMGRIASSAALGGVLGGVAAERVGTTLGTSSLLPMLAALSGLAALAAAALARQAPPPHPRDEAASSPVAVFARAPYLRDLAALVLLVTISGTLVDYVLKAEAASAHTSPEGLLRFFAAFHTAVGVFTFAVQAAASRPTLERFGLGVTAASLPGAVVVGAAIALALPTFANVAALRGLEAVLRSSLFRSAYELFFNPVPPRDKRGAKTLVDVGFERLGDAVGAGIARGALFFAAEVAHAAILGIAAVASLGALVVTRRLGRGYVLALERSLLERAVDLDEGVRFDKTTRTLYLTLTGGLGGAASSTRQRALLVEIADLASDDDARILRVLSRGLQPELVPFAVRLLSRESVEQRVVAALRKGAAAWTDRLVDALLDPSLSQVARARLARIVRDGDEAPAVAGLTTGLGERDFEVRVACARSLAVLRRSAVPPRIDRDAVLQALRAETAVDRATWRSREGRLEVEEADGPTFESAESRSLDHLFTLLSLLFPREPLQAAYAGLRAGDARARGTALEYLETLLPEDVSASLARLIED